MGEEITGQEAGSGLPSPSPQGCDRLGLPLAMSTASVQQGALDSPIIQPPPQSWGEFCEFHAIAAARDLASHYQRFARDQDGQEVVAADDFSELFSGLFQQHFSSEVAKEDTPLTPSTTPPPPLVPPTPANACWPVVSFPGVRCPEQMRSQTFLALLASKVEPLVPTMPLNGRRAPPEPPVIDAVSQFGPLLGGHRQEEGLLLEQTAECPPPHLRQSQGPSGRCLQRIFAIAPAGSLDSA
ncbi:hypothetical protein GJAV_G00050140 [Gymnothorax javanicus]|nr:hypothetical protein GJAV_G00050140 [Gymnothorax javanicus]